MLYDMTGKVAEIGEVQTFASGFTKRELVVDATESNRKYPNMVKFTATKDNCSLLDGLTKGMEVSVRFAVEGRQWDGPKGRQYFVDLKVVRVEAAGAAAKTKPVPAPATPSSVDVGDVGDADDFPF